MCEDPRTTKSDAEWEALREAERAARRAEIDALPSMPAPDPAPAVMTEGIPFTPNYDLTGPWSGPRGRINVTEARQLGEGDYRGIPEPAFRASFPNEADPYGSYQQALLERTQPIVESSSDWGPLPTTGSLIDDGQPA